MKRSNLLFLLPILILSACNGKKQINTGKADAAISFSGAFAMYPLMQVWAREYNKTHPEVRFDIQAGGAGKGLTDCLAGAIDVGMFSRELTDAEKAKGVWWISLCKDAVIPVMSAKNPYLSEIQKRGIKKEEFKSIFVDGKINAWEQLLNKTGSTKINVYTRADAAGAADSWASFFGMKQENLKGVGVSGDPGLAEAVKKDMNGIGYNNTLFIFDAQSGKKMPGIEVVPIDVNQNGVIDDSEKVYESLSTFLQAVNDGRFPSPPARP
ncbi:MAG: substrate-binding domain-containing protein, partial [Ginsengibacter sp.]